MRTILPLLLFPFFLMGFDLDDWQTITNMNDVQALAGDQSDVWAATTGGIFRYQTAGGELIRYTNIEGLASVNMHTILIDSRGTVAAGGEEGIVEFMDPQTQTWRQIYELQGNTIRDMAVRDDSLWVAAGKGVGLFLWDGARYVFYDYYYRFPVLINSIDRVELYNQRVWLASDNGLLSAPSDVNNHTINNPAEWSVYETGDGLPSATITALYDRADTLWVGTAKGLAIVKNDLSLQKMTNWGEGSGYIVSDIKSNAQGLLMVNGKVLFLYSAVQGRSSLKVFSQQINAVLGGSSLSYMTALDNGGIYQSDPEGQYKIDGPSRNIMRYVIKDHSGRIWTSSSKFLKSTRAGFSIFENNRWINTGFTPGRWADIGNSVVLYEDHFQNIWIGSWGGGIMSLTNEGDTIYFHGHNDSGKMLISTVNSYEERDQTNATRYHDFISGTPTSLPNYDVITGFRQDDYGHLWIANYWPISQLPLIAAPYTNDNYVSLIKDNWAYFRLIPGEMVEGASISCLDIDFNGDVWCGTLEQGVYILDYNGTLYDQSDDRVDTKQERDGLYSNNIRSIAADNDGVVWIGTSSGLNSYDGVNIYKHVGDPEGKTGPLDNNINFIFVDSYNNRWFATSGGVSVLRADHSPWDPDAWIGYTSENSNLLSNQVNCIYADSRTGETIIATEAGLSIYRGTFAQVRPDYHLASGGPNPFVLAGATERFTITNLKKNSSVKIYSISGKLVRFLRSDNGYVDGSRAVWDGRDETGQLVSSGIYLFTAYDQEGASTAGKIAVVRR